MDCSLSAAAAAAGPAVTPDAHAAASGCDQGRRFTELLNVPDEPGAAASPVADTYVPAAEPLPSGGIVLTSVIEQVRSFASPGLQMPPATSGGVGTGNDPAVGADSLADIADVMGQLMVAQKELVRVSMMSDIVSSTNQGVRTLFQQQG